LNGRYQGNTRWAKPGELTNILPSISYANILLPLTDVARVEVLCVGSVRRRPGMLTATTAAAGSVRVNARQLATICCCSVYF